ncbi:uncharacterized protein LOC126846956 [Adelges cooleyi]|uniref:uncharacterized protein LOC126846956 n=1 Tax=Adelges cooleyi TaxID=133065 RepID=UPI00217FBB91|nr:uncharacterized protein LOC126846956 [Adelges cooleyi]
MAAFQKTNSKQSKYLILNDFERLDAHVESDADLLIKNLALKQADKCLTLEKHLSQERDFVTSHEYVSVTEYTKGAVTLPEFCSKAEEVAFDQRNYNNSYDPELKIEDCLSRHERELALCVKPNSTETKLLQFALSCKADKKQKHDLRPSDHPINNLPSIVDEKFSHLDVCPIKTSKMILRKRRQLLQSISKPIEISHKPIRHYNKPNTLWDQTDCTKTQNLKFYTCDTKQINECIGVLNVKNETSNPPKMNSVNGQRFVSSSTCSILLHNFTKITEDEIKNLPPFKNYQKGVPSKTLYLKNIAKNVNENHLISVFDKYKKLQNKDIVYRFMKQGRMKGQAFIEFENAEISSQALHENNGVVIEGKPLVIVFGKQQKSLC